MGKITIRKSVKKIANHTFGGFELLAEGYIIRSGIKNNLIKRAQGISSGTNESDFKSYSDSWQKVVEGGIREENGIDLDRMNKAHDTKQNIYCVRF